MQQTKLTKTYLLLLLVPLFWGGAFGTTKHALTELLPLTESALRFLLGSLFLVLLSTWKKHWKWKEIRQSLPELFFLGLTGVFCYNFFFATGLKYTTAINAALIIVINPAVTALTAILFMGEAWNSKTVVGILLSFGGVLLVITKGSLAALTTLSIGKGELYMFGAVISWVLYTLGIKKALPLISTNLATTVSTIIGAILLLLASLLYENQWSEVLSVSLQTKLELLYLALFATLAAFLLYNWGIEKIGATKASAYCNLTPVSAVLIAVAFYGESIYWYHLLGMPLTILGIVLTTHSTANDTA